MKGTPIRLKGDKIKCNRSKAQKGGMARTGGGSETNRMK
jgi:hypothetical protein